MCCSSSQVSTNKYALQALWDLSYCQLPTLVGAARAPTAFSGLTQFRYEDLPGYSSSHWELCNTDKSSESINRLPREFKRLPASLPSQSHRSTIIIACLSTCGAQGGESRVTNGVPPLSTTNPPVRLTPFVTPTSSPYPLAVMLIMLTSRGGQGSFVLSIDQP